MPTKIELAEEKDVAALRKQREQAPSSRLQSESYKFYRESLSLLGTPYDVTHIPISVLQQMQRDPMVAFALHFIRTPIIRANWHIECEDAQVAAFIDNALRPIMPRFINQYSQSWSFGFSPIVKRFQLENPDWKYLDPSKSEVEVPVWNNGSVEAITWKPFVGLPSDPSICEPQFNAKGEFNGIRYTPPHGSQTKGFPFGSEDRDGNKTIDGIHSLWTTNERDSVHGSLWGFPRIGYAYRYWWSYWFRWALYDRYFERKADPPYLVYYPAGGNAGDYIDGDVEGEEQVSLRDIALGIGESAKSGGAIAMPSQTISSYDDRPSTMREWEIAELEIKGDLSHFVESFEYLDVMKLRSMLLPEQAFLEGKGGTSSRNVASEELDIFKESEATEADAIDDQLNRFVIPDLVRANFPDRNVTARKVTTGFSEADRQAMNQLVQVLGTSDPGALQEVDIREVLDRMGMPLVSRKEIARREEKVREAMEQAVPEPVEPVSGQSAGVDETGLYIQPRDVITLAETSFNAPKTKHYEDSKVRSDARKLKGIWASAYEDAYKDFADYLEKSDAKVSLAEEDEKIAKLVNSLVNKWSFDTKRTKTLLGNSQNLLKRVMGRAGLIELRRANLGSDWNLDSEAVAEWLEDRGLEMARAIDETVKQELRTFLAEQVRMGKTNEQIADAVREHFAEFPEWKADRLVRSEIRNSYNFATLVAGEQNGVKIVLAKDAQLGDTDAHCIERNGKLFKVPDAIKEVTNEHPNGTLEFSLTKRQNLSVEYVDEVPSDIDDALASFDDETETIYFKEGISKEDELIYLDQLGKIFEQE